MSSFLSDPGAPGTKPPLRPPIWSGDRRRWRPDLRLFARATLAEARGWGAPLVQRLAAAIARWGDGAAEGRGRALALRLGRVGRALPTAEQVGAALHGLSRLNAQAALTVAGPPPVEGLPIRPWDGAPGAPAPAPAAMAEPAPVVLPEPAAPPPAPVPGARQGDLATLDLIRSVIRTPVQPARPARTPPPPPPRPRGRGALPDLEPPEPVPPGPLLRAGGRVAGWLWLGLLLPAAAVRVGFAALRGDPPEAG